MWQNTKMVNGAYPVAITRALLETLTIEAMVLADEAESYFGADDEARSAFDADLSIAFACEAFRTAARLKQLVGWLAGHGGEPPVFALADDVSDSPDFARLPAHARAIVAATHELCERVRRLQRQPEMPEVVPSPARLLQERLVASLAR